MTRPDSILQRYQELQQYVGWRAEDAERVRAAGPLVEGVFGPLIDDFYETIERFPAARRVICGGSEQINRLKVLLRRWLEALFTGPYDESHVAARWRTGCRHVEVGLEEIYTAAALARLRSGLVRALAAAWKGDSAGLLATIDSLNKLLDLDLALIQHAYSDERRRMLQENERRRSEAVFRDLVEAAGCMIVILRPDFTIAYFSPYAEQLTGRSRAEVIGQSFLSLFAPQSELGRWSAGIASACGGQTLREFQADVVDAKGERRALLWNARPLEQFEDLPAVLAVGHDITSLREAQAAALHAERLATIGQMAAGMAHESRNALQRIQACAESLEPDLDGNAEALEMVRRIQSAQNHLHQLFEEVRNYAGAIRLDRAEWDLPGIWREAWDLLSGQRGKRDVTLVERVRPSAPDCMVDHFRITQVFRNILENALAACDDPVMIECRCEPALLDGRAAVRVTIGDNGPGLNEEQRRRIFEPFFTTKPKGSGLGMAIAQRLVEAHGGKIAVGDSHLGGAEIVVTLPVEIP